MSRNAIRVPGTCHFLVWPSALQGLSGGRAALDLSQSTMSLSISRGVDASAGTWEAVVLAESDVSYDASGRSFTQVQSGMSAINRIDVNTPVSMGVDHPGGLCLGLVDSVRREVRNVGGQVAVVARLSGRTIGKVLQQDQIAYGALTTPQTQRFNAAVQQTLGRNHPLLVPIKGLWGPKDKDGVITFRGTTIEEVAKWALEFAPSMRVPLLRRIFGGKGDAGDFMQLDASDSWNDARVWSDAVYTTFESFDAFLRMMVDRDFYEIRVDERRREGSPVPQPVLIIRPKPFDDPNMTWAPYRTTNQPNLVRAQARAFVQPEIGAWPVDFDQIKAYSVGRTDAQAYSYYVCTSAHIIAGTEEARAEGLFYPLLDLWAARRFGVKQKTARLNLVGGDVARKSQADQSYLLTELDALRDFRNRLFNWHRLEPEFLKGSVTLRGRDDYRPGDYVDLPIEPHRGGRRGTRFYVTSAQWSWVAGRTYTTTLQLDRGYNYAMIQSINREITQLFEDVSRSRGSLEPATRKGGGTGRGVRSAGSSLNPGMWVSA